MPLTSAIQSAMAVRAEREKRHQRRLSKIRRESGASHASGLSSAHAHTPSLVCTKRQSVASTGTLEEDRLTSAGETGPGLLRPPPDKSESMVTTFHLGIVFIILGFIMILSSMIPSSIIKADWSRLLGVGLAFIFIGLIMVMVNRILTAREEEELSQYVKQRLSRTRSGQAFVRDTEAGPGHSKPANIVIPDIVKPPAIPSAMKGSMKGSGSHPPRSPKDKVTFAEFTEVLPEKESAKVLSDSEKVTSEAVDSCNNTLEVPSDPTKVTMLDTISELPVTGRLVPLVTPESDLSPSSETSRLLAPVSDSQD